MKGRRLVSICGYRSDALFLSGGLLSFSEGKHSSLFTAFLFLVPTQSRRENICPADVADDAGEIARLYHRQSTDVLP